MLVKRLFLFLPFNLSSGGPGPGKLWWTPCFRWGAG